MKHFDNYNIRRFIIDVVFAAAMIGLLTLAFRCSPEPVLEHDMNFEATRIENFVLTVEGKFLPETVFEVWATHQSDSVKQMPIMFLKLDNVSTNEGSFLKSEIFKPYADTFHYGLVKNKVVWFQIRLKDRRGYSNFKTYRMIVNREIKKVLN